MRSVPRPSLAEQTAAHLRTELRAGRWGGKLPGVLPLAEACDVSRPTMRAALRLLETEGVIAASGNGRSRTVGDPAASGASKRTLRVAVLLNEPLGEEDADVQTLLLHTRHALEAAGHTCAFAKRSQAELHHDLPRMVRQIRETPADAWVVQTGSRELLQWFAEGKRPVLAYCGRSLGLPIAAVGPDGLGVYLRVARHLVALGHHRIVLITPHHYRHPKPTPFLAEIGQVGRAATAYHVPDWEETPAG